VSGFMGTIRTGSCRCGLRRVWQLLPRCNGCCEAVNRVCAVRRSIVCVCVRGRSLTCALFAVCQACLGSDKKVAVFCIVAQLYFINLANPVHPPPPPNQRFHNLPACLLVVLWSHTCKTTSTSLFIICHRRPLKRCTTTAKQWHSRHESSK